MLLQISEKVQGLSSAPDQQRVEKPPMKRILQLDGVRALAFVLIFCRHALNVPLLWAGVDVFFVLSGFLITSILMDGRGKQGAWSHFYERRALRILPPLILMLIAATYLFKLHWGMNAFWYLLFAMNFAEAKGVGQPGLGILWSLAVEEQFYLFWPFIALKFPPATVMRIAIALIALAPILRGIATPFFSDHWAVFYLMPFRMDLLAAGAVMAVLWRQGIALRLWRKVGLWMMASGTVLFAAFARLIPTFEARYNTTLYNVLGYSLICCAAAGLIAFSLGTERGWWMNVITAKPVRWIGMVSYSAYLVHAGVIGLVRPFGSRGKDAAVEFVLTLAIAALSWFAVERPLLRLRPAAWLQRRKKQAA